MPNNHFGNALHLALASYYKCDFLLTWNCKHIANANKFQHIQNINSIFGFIFALFNNPIRINKFRGGYYMKDELIDEIQRVRKKISEENDNDIEKIINYYIKLQEQHKDRLLDSVNINLMIKEPVEKYII